MRYRTTFVLLVLFFVGLGALWYADYARVPSRLERQIMANRLLPELIDTPPGEVIRLEIDRGSDGESIAVERVKGSRWQMVKPVNTAADSELADVLVKTLKDLGKSADAGTIEGDASNYGFSAPAATVKVFVKDRKDPVVLDVGKSYRERVYVRPGGDSGVEVIDSRLLNPVFLKASAWRDRSMFHLPSFQVESLTVDERDPTLQIQVKRDERHWRLVQPFEALADDDKVEGLVAEVTTLRVDDASRDFIEDDVKDLAKYGLDVPSWKITLGPFANGGTPQSVLFGKSVPGKPDHRYAIRGDQDEVVSIDVKRLREAVPGPNGLRSQKVLDFAPNRVSKVRIDTPGMVFDLARSRNRWELLSPMAGPADGASVQSLLVRLSELKASEFFEVSQVTEPRVDSPTYRVRIWQTDRPSSGASTASASSGDAPKVDLNLGRNDTLKKSVYGRIQGDATILAIPDEVLKDLPRSVFAYRDRSVLNLKPEDFTSVTVERAGSKVTVIPNGVSGKSMKSRMKEPIDAPTDEAAVTSLILTLANLRAESWESDSIPDPAAFGFDPPWLRVKWKLQKGPGQDTNSSKQEGTLRIGRLKSRNVSFFANLEGDSRVFVLNGGVVAAFEAELHDKTVYSFKPDTAERMTLGWPSRSLSLVAAPRPASTPTWQPVEGFDASRFDFSKVTPLVRFFSDLKTSRYFQYEGPIQEAAGLNPPRLIVSMTFAGASREAVLRIGNSRPDGTCFATTSSGPGGPIFLLIPDEPLTALLRPPGRSTDLPDDPFVPSPPATKPHP